jgi:hypothetical protein
MSNSILASVRRKERVDESFLFDTKTTFNINLQIEPQFLRAVIFNNEREKFVMQAELSHAELKSHLQEALEKTDFLQKDFSKVRYISTSPVFAIIPDELYDRNEEEQYLSFNNHVHIDQRIFSNSIKNANAKIIFSIPVTEVSLVRKKFDEAQFFHSATPLIEALILINKNKSGKKLYINIEEHYMEIVVIDDSEFRLYNIFTYKSVEDFVYFPLFVCQQLNLNPEQIEVQLTGNIDKVSEKYSMIYKYFTNINLMQRNDHFQYAYKLNEVEAHHFFNLFNGELCE